MDDVYFDTSHRPNHMQISPFSPEKKLGTAIKNKESLDRIRSLVKEGADISCLCDYHWTPLTLAAYFGRIDLVTYFLQCIREQDDDQSTLKFRYHVTVDSVNDGGATALFCAAHEGHYQLCRVLLEAGADINARCLSCKQTPLLTAATAKQHEVVDVLLEFGVDVQISDNVGITPLYAAIDANVPDIVQKLIDAGCDVNIGSQDHAPLFLAARRGLISIAQILCDSGCYKDISNKYGCTPLYEAACKGQNEMVKHLIMQGCDPDRCDMYGVTPMQTAIFSGNLHGVRLLVDAGASLKWRNSQGQCAVQIALETGKDDILEYFLKSGVDVSKRPNLNFIGTAQMSPLRIVFERSAFPKTILVLLRGCSRLDLRMINNLGYFKFQPILLELAFASGQAYPPSRVLTLHSVRDFSPTCQQWLTSFHSKPMTLKCLARASIRCILGNTILHNTDNLPLPKSLRKFIMFTDAHLLPGEL